MERNFSYGKHDCDWCDGGACDLVIGRENGITADIDEEGMMRVYVNGEEKASRRVRFCPMCGKPFGLWSRCVMVP